RWCARWKTATRWRWRPRARPRPRGGAEPMGVVQAAAQALRTMREHRMRTLLTVLGTVTGVAFLITVITVIEGMGHYIEHDLVGKIYGFNTVKVRRRPVTMDGDAEEARRYARNPMITFADAAWLAEQME